MTPERWNEVKSVFQAALEHEPADRPVFVASACGADADLRREVESLLGEHSTRPPLESPLRPSDIAGQVVSHYRILERVGQGGMGVVYKAEDLKLHRLVALKFLTPGACLNQEYRARFEQEARSLAAVDHPNICPVHEIDESRGQLFLAMAFVEGPTLKDRIREGPLDVTEAVRLLAGAADGLHAAHQMGVVHRDVKSANILLGPGGRALLTDFGIALTEARAGSVEPCASAGTPGYMSPEQVHGGPLDRRSDIWSLGAVLYEAIAGTLPSAAEEPASLTRLRPGAPAALDRIVRRALAKDPARRYQTAAELAAALRALPLGPAPARPRRRLFVRALAVAGAIVLLVCFLVVLWGYLRPVETVRVSLAVLPLDNLSGDPEQQYFTDGMTDAITTDLARIGTLRVLSHTTSAAYLNRPDPLQAMARDLQVASVVEGSVLRAGNRVRISVRLVDTKSSRHLWAQNYEGDLRDILLLQSSVAQAIAQEVRVRLTAGEQAQLASRERVNPKAYEAYLKGRHLTLRWRREDIHKGRDWFRVAIAEDPKYAAAWLGLADTYITEGFYWGTKPLDLLPEAERCAQKALELDPAMAAPHRVLALIAGVYRRDWPEAKRRFDRSFALDPTGVWSHYNYAAYYLVPTGRFEEALREIRIARDIDPASPNIATMTGWVHFFRRDYVPAAAEFRKALELDHDFAYARMGLSTVLALQGDPAGALALNSSLETTAWLHALLGHAAEARRLLKDMAERSRREYVGGYEMGYIHAALGETTLALQQLERSYDDCQPHLADLAVDPRLDSLRDLPRFQALVRKMNLAR